MAELKLGTTIGGYRQLHEGITNPTLNSDTTINGNIKTTGSLIFKDENKYIIYFDGYPTWGIYWDTNYNQFQFRGAGQNKVTINLDDGAVWTDGTITQAGFNGNASSQSKLSTQRTITLSGAVTGSASFDGSQNITITTSVNHNHDSSYVKLSGSTMTGTLTVPLLQIDNSYTKLDKGSNNSLRIQTNSGYVDIGPQNTSYAHIYTDRPQFYFNKDIKGQGKVWGAVYNDYQEYRLQKEEIEPGYVAITDTDGRVKKCNKDRQRNIAGVVSDVFGFAIGKVKGEISVPIQVAGRVLIYQKDKHKLKQGDQVCSTKDGRVRKMKWWEKILFPEQIVGYVDEIPTYEEWGQDKIKVNKRIWIRLK